jgi:hypothetical protein
VDLAEQLSDCIELNRPLAKASDQSSKAEDIDATAELLNLARDLASCPSAVAREGCMKQPTKHHLVDFAARYAGTRFQTLNVSSALWRAEALVLDAEEMLEVKKAAEGKEIRFGSRLSTYEIVSYFAVGFVTCLEWHARSRLIDLMVYKPSCITTSDLEGIARLALSQMMAERVTVPHLIGAATHVSKVTEYIAVFTRIFDALDIKVHVERELRNVQSDIELYREDGDKSLHSVIEHLFEYRNQLVHEIDLSVIGHFSLRDMWDLDRAIVYGNAIISAIKLVEGHLTKYAPQDFPNRLTADGRGEDEYEKLQKAIASIEAELTSEFQKEDDLTKPWEEALKSSQQSLKLEIDFLGKAEFLRPIRHLDMRRSVQIDCLKSRLTYLTILKSELDQAR